MKRNPRDMVLAGWAAAVVRMRIAVLRRELARLKSPDEDAIHDVRVATRRLRAALRHFRPCFPRAAVVHANDAVRSLAGLLGGVRDIDIVLQNLPAAQGAVTVPAVIPGGRTRPAGGTPAPPTQPVARWRTRLKRQRAAQLRRLIPMARALGNRLPSLKRGFRS